MMKFLIAAAATAVLALAMPVSATTPTGDAEALPSSGHCGDVTASGGHCGDVTAQAGGNVLLHNI